MRYSKMLLPTLKEDPAEAELASHKLMVRAGMIRKLAAGIYTFLPLGYKVLRKVEAIVRRELVRAGCQEVLMPASVPKELWEETGRWRAYGKELLRFKDRHDREFCFGPTHEEVITDMVRRDVRSYRDLPLNLFQIQMKFRDEIRPRFGLMRGREFLMKDGYSFHVDYDDLDREYKNMYEIYHRIFKGCGLDCRAVEADTGAIGGSASHEFMILADSGEDALAFCDNCNYAANTEKAETQPRAAAGGAPEELVEVHTPDQKTIEDIAAFLKQPASQMIKTLIFQTDTEPVMALIAGDLELNEVKLKNASGAAHLELADEETIQRVTGAPVGFAGPVKPPSAVRIFADLSVKGMVNAATGANRRDYHYTGVCEGRDFQIPEENFADLRLVVEGDPCPRCEGGKLGIRRGIEVGHVFKLGTKYSKSMKATYLDEAGEAKDIVMGCYGVGVGRLAAAAIEQYHDKDGLTLPRAIAPFEAAVLCLDPKDGEVMAAAEGIYEKLLERGVDALLDDREERPGVKFKDIDLIGPPLKIIVGARGLKKGAVELKRRLGGAVEEVEPGRAAERALELLGEL